MANGRVGFATRLCSILIKNKEEIFVLGTFTVGVFASGLAVGAVKGHFDLQHARKRAEQQLQVEMGHLEQQGKVEVERRKLELHEARVHLAEEQLRAEKQLFDAAFHYEYMQRRSMTVCRGPRES